MDHPLLFNGFIVRQLRACARVKDLANNPLNLYEFFQINYEISRARKSAGKAVTVIDWHTNAYMREQFFYAMVDFYKTVYSDTLRFNADPRTNTLGFVWDEYQVPFPSDIKIAIISSEFFNDWYDEHNAMSQPSVGNLMLCLDIGKPGPQGGSIYYAQLAANRKNYTTAKIEELARLDSTFRCVMQTTSFDQTLTSETDTVIVECPLHSLWIQNITLAKPVITGKSLPYSDLY